MTHGEKTLLFLAELEGLFQKYNVKLGYDSAKAKFVLQDLNGVMPSNWKDELVDLSVHRVEEKTLVQALKELEAEPVVDVADEDELDTSDEVDG